MVFAFKPRFARNVEEVDAQIAGVGSSFEAVALCCVRALARSQRGRAKASTLSKRKHERRTAERFQKNAA